MCDNIKSDYAALKSREPQPNNQQETRQDMLFLGNYDIDHVPVFTSLVTKSVLFIGHSYINQADIFTSAHH